MECYVLIRYNYGPDGKLWDEPNQKYGAQREKGRLRLVRVENDNNNN